MFTTPIIILSYGQFAETFKIFSYEVEGIHTLPVFKSPEKAMIFQSAVNEALAKMPDQDLPVAIQICSDRRKALDIFEMIAMSVPDLRRVVTDPDPPAPENRLLIEDSHDIHDVVDSFRESVTNGPISPSNTDQPSSSS